MDNVDLLTLAIGCFATLIVAWPIEAWYAHRRKKREREAAAFVRELRGRER